MAKKVTVYSTTSCSSCRMVKMLLKTKNVDYTEVNLDEQPEVRQHVIQMSGAMTVPVTIVEDETGNTDITIGWNPAKLSAAVAA